MSLDPSPLAAVGRDPIPGSARAGESASDDPSFEELRAEVQKDPVREVTDWGRVVTLASEVLEQRSKDFTAGAYLAVGLLETRGYPGLLDGLAILTGLHEVFWDDGFPPLPKRLRGRANAVQWMVERAATWIERRAAEPADREAIAACLQACSDLDKVLGERFPEGDVGAGTLLRALREQLERLPQPNEPGAAAAPAATAPAASVAAEPAAPAAGSGTDLEIRSQSDAQLLIFKIAAFLRQKEPTSPTPYHLVRAYRWTGIATAPPASEGKTQIIPPAAETVALLRRTLEARDWAGLLEHAESAFRAGSPLWLDLQRFVATALDGLGPSYAGVRDGVVAELRALLRRLPGLVELRFRDDLPFADPETRVWLSESLGEEAGPAVRAPTAPASAEGVDPETLAQARREARRLVKDSDLAGALAALAPAVDRPGTPRAEFLVRLEVASLCAELGRDRLAFPMLQALDETVRHHGLEAWEPALATRVLEALYRSTKRLAGQRGASPDLAARAEETFVRLCRVDPAAAAGVD
jgi:type VI secretion system protein VasJ